MESYSRQKDPCGPRRAHVLLSTTLNHPRPYRSHSQECTGNSVQNPHIRSLTTRSSSSQILHVTAPLLRGPLRELVLVPDVGKFGPECARVLEAALRSWDELKARRVGADSRKLSLEAMAPVAPTPCRKPTLPDHSPTPHQAYMQDPHPRPLRGAGCDSRAPRHPLPNAILPVARNPPHPFFLPQGPPSGGMFA